MRLAGFERRWAAEIGAALLPPSALGGAREGLDYGEALGREARLATWGAASVLRLALWLVWLAPLWRDRRPRTFGSLDGAQREELLEQLLESPRYLVRELLALLKIFVCQACLGDRRVLARLGCYDLGGGAVDLRGRP